MSYIKKGKVTKFIAEQPEDYKIIPLTQGVVCKVDNEDFEYLSQFNWHCTRGYASCAQLGVMHRVLAKTPKGKLTDHVNGDRADNRKSNLRVVTNQENSWNSSNVKFNYKFKGTSHRPGLGKCWRARIFFKGKECHIGYFHTEEEAALAYNKKATELFGEYAKINNI